MRGKQSSTAAETCRRSGSLTTPIPNCVVAPSLPGESALCPAEPLHKDTSLRPAHSRSGSDPEMAHGKGLLHDAHNLMGALRLYCDLLSMPDVLKPEYHHYAEELRLLDTRCEALIEHLIQLLLQEGLDSLAAELPSDVAAAGSSIWPATRIAGTDAVGCRVSLAKPVSLRRAEVVLKKRIKTGNALGEVSVANPRTTSRRTEDSIKGTGRLEPC